MMLCILLSLYMSELGQLRYRGKEQCREKSNRKRKHRVSLKISSSFLYMWPRICINQSICWESTHVRGDTCKHIWIRLSINSTTDIQSVTCQDNSEEDFNQKKAAAQHSPPPRQKRIPQESSLYVWRGKWGEEERVASCQEFTSH